MTSTARQNNLIVSEDWKKIYQSFKKADFRSYDFENIRRTMIDYLRTNYPEDYNDYIESSEYLALIDLIAFLGQSLSFRVDLNARDNFLELAERRESILRLANLVAYNPKRSVPAHGLLKFSTISTTEAVLDSNGRDLAGQTISWNDSSNNNWFDQFISVLNSAFPSQQKFGNPYDSATIYNVPTTQYRFNSNINGVPIFSFNKVISGQSMNFEISSTTFSGKSYVYEEAPLPNNTLACLYRDDGKGAGSPSNGFFLYFTQGVLNQGIFTITQPSNHESVDIDTTNINNDDVWLYSLDSDGNEDTIWTKVPALQGNNVVYNSLNQNIKNIYAVTTRTQDAISLQFSNGTFGNLPLGSFKVYYRTGNNLDYTINPADITSVTISFPYTSATNQPETLTLTLNLASSVNNAASSETNEEIQRNAPQTYYTQNRMVTAEDYNISPLSSSNQVLKVQAVNRLSSGISRYFDLIDPTGKYSSTTLYGSDGVIYTEKYISKFLFSWLTTVDIQGIIYNNIFEIVKNPNLKNFYYSNYAVSIVSSLDVFWYQKTADRTMSSGFIGGNNEIPSKVGTYTATNLQYVQVGSLVQFTAPAGKFFDINNYNSLVTTTVDSPGLVREIWAQVISVNDDGTASGTGLLSSGFGPISLNKEIPSGAIVSGVLPAWNTSLSLSTIATMVDLISSNQPFGLSYNSIDQSWQIIFETNLNIISPFSLSRQGDKSNTQADASWLLLFTTDNIVYTVSTRQQRYVFESDKQLTFYFDNSKKIYNVANNTVLKDTVNVLSVNKKPDALSSFTVDYSWDIIDSYIGLDGFVDNKKLVVSFAENDTNGAVDNPKLFDIIVSPPAPTEVNQSILQTKYVIFEKYQVVEGQEDYRYVSNQDEKVIILDSKPSSIPQGAVDGQYYYFIDTETLQRLDKSTSTYSASLDYKVFVGRDNLKFQYVHNADYESRINPGATNIIDIYVLTKNYDTLYRQWIEGSVASEPLPPSSAELFDLLNPSLSSIKSISDEIVYHPVKYTPLFGSNSDPSVQATFQVVKTSGQVISDSEVQSRVITAINEFFALENWDFGDTFYFTELSTYVMNKLSPYISMFLLVPKQGDLNFGSLLEISCLSNQLFVSTAIVSDVVIVSGITPSAIKAIPGTTMSSIVTSSQVISSSNYGN